MLQFIHSNFKIDLTHLEVIFTEVNQLFSDEFSNEFSFPFDFPINEDFAKNMGFNIHVNGVNDSISFSGTLDRDGILIDATLSIDKVVGLFASATISAGKSNFPNFSKKLPELPLENFTVSNIADHALTIIEKDYPEVNYDFRMVHTDKYDPESQDFFSFGKIINHYASGAFFQNYIDSGNIDQILNIIQPFPYLMYVLKKAIEDAGYTLEGDILTDSDLNRALLFKDAEYYAKTSGDSIDLSILTTDFSSIEYTLNGKEHVYYTKSVTIDKKGLYKISGGTVCLSYWKPFVPGTAIITDLMLKVTKISGSTSTVLYNLSATHNYNAPSFDTIIKTKNIDVNVNLEVGDIIKVEKIEPRRSNVSDNPTPYYPEAVTLDIFPLRYYYPDGSPILITTNFDKIDLKLCVPNVTVSELIKFIKDSKGYKFIPDGNVVYMNKIKPTIDRQTAVDLKMSEIENPERVYDKKKSFEMTFQDMNANEKYKYDTAYFDKSGLKINVYEKQNDTVPITINGLPLPVIERQGIRTAYALDDAPDKIRLIFRNPLGDGLPVTFWNENFTTPKLLENDLMEWLQFRIDSVKYQWESIVSVEKMREININSLIYAYSNYHLMTELEKERIDLLWWRVVFKTECLT